MHQIEASFFSYRKITKVTFFWGVEQPKIHFRLNASKRKCRKTAVKMYFPIYIARHLHLFGILGSPYKSFLVESLKCLNCFVFVCFGQTIIEACENVVINNSNNLALNRCWKIAQGTRVTTVIEVYFKSMMKMRWTKNGNVKFASFFWPNYKRIRCFCTTQKKLQTISSKSMSQNAIDKCKNFASKRMTGKLNSVVYRMCAIELDADVFFSNPFATIELLIIKKHLSSRPSNGVPIILKKVWSFNGIDHENKERKKPNEKLSNFQYYHVPFANIFV